METLGQVLKRYRTGAKLSVEEFSKLTKLPPKVMLSMEEDEFSSLPGDFYIRGYIKNYARYLNLNYEKLIDLYQKQIGGQLKKEDVKVRNYTKAKVVITPRQLKIVGLVGVAVVLIAYLYIQFQQIFAPPYLEVTQPPQDIVTTETFIEIAGRTEQETQVFLNDKEIFTDADGSFSTTLDLFQGINLIKVSAKKKHSRESVVFREILVQ